MQIKPHNVIVPGFGIQTAEQLVVTSDGDDLRASAELRVALLSAAGAELVWTHMALTGSDYTAWDAYAPDYHGGAHKIAAAALGLTLI